MDTNGLRQRRLSPARYVSSSRSCLIPTRVCSCEETGKCFDRLFDRCIIDIEVGHQPNTGQVANTCAHTGSGQVCVKRPQAVARDIDEDHVGEASLHDQGVDCAQPCRESFGAGVVISESGDMVIKRVQTCSGKNAGLPHATPEHLAPAPGYAQSGF